jgi:hypothetical protein
MYQAIEMLQQGIKPDENTRHYNECPIYEKTKEKAEFRSILSFLMVAKFHHNPVIIISGSLINVTV